MRIRLLVASLACCLSAAVLADAPTPDLGGRTALDLTGPAPAAPVAGAEVTTRDAAITVADCPEPATGQLPWLDEDESQADAHERERMAATHGVTRTKDGLELAPKDGKPLRFVDWTLPERPDADGDFMHYRYAGTIAGGGWWRVEVQYGHDAPSSWLVNGASGHAVHVHNGGETSTLSADGRWLATFDTNSAPYRLAVVYLGDAAPSLAVDCLFTPPDESVRPTGCGFHDARYEARWSEAGGGMSLERTRDGWQLSGRVGGLGAACRAPR